MKNEIDPIEISEIENYIAYIRPPEEIRNKLDISYRIENQSVILFEIRPQFNDETKITETDMAKATFVKKNNHWKVFWMRADQKWHTYPPHPIVPNLLEFIRIVEKDENGCFWG